MNRYGVQTTKIEGMAVSGTWDLLREDEADTMQDQFSHQRPYFHYFLLSESYLRQLVEGYYMLVVWSVNGQLLRQSFG